MFGDLLLLRKKMPLKKNNERCVAYWATSCCCGADSSGDLSGILSGSIRGPKYKQSAYVRRLFATIDRQGLSKVSVFTVTPPSSFPERVLSGAYGPSFGRLASGSRRGDFGLFSFVMWESLECLRHLRGDAVPALVGSSHSALKAGQVATCSCGYLSYVLHFVCGYFKVICPFFWGLGVGVSRILQDFLSIYPIRPIIKGYVSCFPSFVEDRRLLRLDVRLFRFVDGQRRRVIFCLRRQAGHVLLPDDP